MSVDNGSLEWFKSNMETIENALASESTDPTNHLANLLSWITWARNVSAPHGSADSERVLHLFQTSLPKATTGLLGRSRFDHDRGLIEAKDFLLTIADMLAHELPVRPNELSPLLKTLFEQRHNFYLKHGFPNNPPVMRTSIQTSAVADVSPADSKNSLDHEEDRNWLAGFDEGDYLDACNSQGVWEMVECESINVDRTQLAVTWGSGVKEWLNMNDTSRVQAFGSRVGLEKYEKKSDDTSVEEIHSSSFGLDDSPAPSDIEKVESKYIVEEVGVGTTTDTTNIQSDKNNVSVDDVSRREWIKSLKQGSLLDVCNKHGVWFEACIMEVMILDSAQNENESSSRISCMEENQDQSMLELKTEPLQSTKSGLNELENQLHRTEEENESDLNESCVSMSDILLQHFDETKENESDTEGINFDSAVGLIMPPKAPSPPVVSLKPVTVFFRISFMGCLEFEDEWVDAFSGYCTTSRQHVYSFHSINELSQVSSLLAPLGQISMQHRGAHHARPEVKYCLDLHRLKQVIELEHDMQSTSPDEIPLAQSPCDTLISPFYARVVDIFLRAGGMEAILHNVCGQNVLEELGSSSKNVVVCNTADVALEEDVTIKPQQVVKMSSVLVLLSSFGQWCEVLSLPVLRLWFGRYLTQVSRLVGGLQKEVLREISIEMLDEILCSVECMAIMLHGHQDASCMKVIGGAVDPLRMTVIAHCLTCDYLNKRLGGLKLLTDWVAKVEKFHEYPTGLQTNRCQSPPTNGKTAEELVPKPQGLGIMSYSVVPVTSTTPSLLGAWILSRDLLRPLLFGEKSHLSLTQRSTELLKFLSRHGLLDDAFIKTLFQIEIEGVLVELVPILSYSSLGNIIVYISELSTSNVTISMCKLLSLIVHRCRDVLMWAPAIGNASCDEGSQLAHVMDLHISGLKLLWKYGEENAEVDKSLSVVCMELLTDCVERGCNAGVATDHTQPLSHDTVNATESGNDVKQLVISWANHWRRCYPIVHCALCSLQEKSNLILSLGVVRNFILSFLDHPKALSAALLSVDTDDCVTLPPYRAAVVRYLESRFHVLELISQAILDLKTKFVEQASFLYISETGEMCLPLDPSQNISSAFQEQLNQIRVGSGRHSYYFTLDKATSFICFFQRASFSKLLGSDTHLLLDYKPIQDIWEKERELVVGFIPRLLSLGKKPEPGSSVTSNQDFFAYCTPETVKLIFEELLTPRSSVESNHDHYSLSIMKCIEKYYCWLGIHQGYLELTRKPPPTSASSPRNYFTILRPLSEHSEWKVFLRLIMTITEDAVAREAVALLTDFPQRLSSNLKWQGHIEKVREMLLSCCMTELTSSGALTRIRLRRSLMLLFALLNESEMSDEGNDLRRLAHSNVAIGQGSPIPIKVLFSQHSDKSKRSQIITVYSNDTVDDFVSAVSKLLGYRRQNLKIIRGGKEIMTDPNRINSSAVVGPKLSTRLINLKLMHEEAIQVVKRAQSDASAVTQCVIGPVNHPAKMSRTVSPQPMPSADEKCDTIKSSDTDDNIDDMSQKSYKVSFDSFPAVVLATRQDYLSSLFRLLNDTDDEQLCDDLWHLISRLPTSPILLEKWHSDPDLKSSDENPTDRLFTLFPSSLTNFDTESRYSRSIAQLLYNLQIVNAIIQPPQPVSKCSDENNTSYTIGISKQVDLTAHERRAWVYTFLSSGGSQAVLSALEEITFQLQKKVKNMDKKTVQCEKESSKRGLSSTLLLCSLTLTTKLMRAVTIRTALVLPIRIDDCSSATICKFLSTLQKSTGFLTPKKENGENLSCEPSQNDVNPNIECECEVEGNVETKSDDRNHPPPTNNTPTSLTSIQPTCDASNGSRPPCKKAKLEDSSRPSDSSSCYFACELPFEEWGSNMDLFFERMRCNSNNNDGKKLHEPEVVFRGDFVETLSLTTLQHILCGLLTALRGFSHSPLFYYDSDGDSRDDANSFRTVNITSSERVMQVEDSQKALMETANNVFLTWCCVLTMKPNLVRQVLQTEISEDSNVIALVESLLTGRVSTSVVLTLDMNFASNICGGGDSDEHNQIGTSHSDSSKLGGLHGNTALSMKKTYLSAAVGHWGSQALAALLHLIWLLDGKLEQSSQWNFEEIRSGFLDIVLLVRSQSTCRSLDSFVSAPFNEASEYLSMKPLISFCVSLLSSYSKSCGDSPSQLISAGNLNVYCKQLFDELLGMSKERKCHINEDMSGCLENVNGHLHLLSGKFMSADSLANWKSSYIGETLELLVSFSSAISSLVDTKLVACLDRTKVCDLVLSECLGVVPCTRISLSTLCQQHKNSDANSLHTDACFEAYNLLRLYTTDISPTSDVSHKLPAQYNEEQDPASLLNTLSQAYLSVVDDLQGLDWNFNPARDVRAGYVGLKNMGATCYMNSLIQVIFMNPFVRRQVSDCRPLLTDVNDGEACAQNIDKKENLAYQLQDMFCALEHSSRKAYNPQGWLHAFKDPLGQQPVNVMVQQDAQEFLGLLFHRLEGQLLMPFVSHGDRSQVPILDHYFGGTLVNQIVKEEDSQAVLTPNDDGNNNIRENSEPFVCISLDVKGCEDLESSLKKFVTGESFSDYTWELNEPRVAITKRQCLLNEKMPKSIIFHLKRFEFNLDTFMREKVNDEFSFPIDTTLDLYPYTKDGLKTAGQDRFSNEEHRIDSESYQYTLGAVVVHTGTAEGGHYFSYIKESADDVITRLSSQSFNCDDSMDKISPDDIEKNRRWIEFNDTEVSIFPPTRLPAECFGGVTVSHDYDLHTHNVETCTIPNPKSAYMLIYQRQERNKHTSPCTRIPNVQPISQHANILVSPILLDNQRHALVTRIFNAHHLTWVLQLFKNTLSKRLLSVCSHCAGDDDTLIDSHKQHEFTIAEQICLCTFFILQILSKTSSKLESMYSEGISFLMKFLNDLPQVKTILPSEIAEFSPADVLQRSNNSKPDCESNYCEMDIDPEVDQENIPPPSMSMQFSSGSDKQLKELEKGGVSDNTLKALRSLKKTYDSLEVKDSFNGETTSINIQEGENDLKQSDTIKSDVNCSDDNDVDDDDDDDDEDMKLALSLSLGDTVAIIGQKDHHSISSPSVPSVPFVTSLVTRYMLQLLLRELYNPLSSPPFSDQNFSCFDCRFLRISHVQDLLFAPALEVRSSYAKLLYKLYCLALEIPDAPGQEGNAATRPRRNMLGSIESRFLFHDILSTSNAPSSAKLLSLCSNEVGDTPTASILSVALVLHLTSNTLFLAAAENWRRCESYFWLLSQIARSSFEAREVMVQRDVLVQLVDLVIGDLSPVCGVLYTKGTRKRAPTSFVSVVPDKSGNLPKHAEPTNLPDFSNLFNLLADLTVSCATDAMLAGKGMPISFCNMSFSGYAGEAINLNAVHSKQISFCLNGVQNTDLTPSTDLTNGSINPHKICMTHETLYSTALRQARYVPSLARMITHMAFECEKFSSDIAELLVRTISFASLSETAHCFEAIAAFLHIEDSLSIRRVHMVLESAGGLFAVLKDFAFVSKNPTKVCVCLTSLLYILHSSQFAREIISTPRSKVASWAAWMLKFCYQFSEKSRKEDQMSLALALSASTSEKKADGDEATDFDEAKFLKSSGPFLLVYGEEDDRRQSSWTTRSSTCFNSLQTMLRGMGEEPDTLIPLDAFEDYDGATSSVSNNTVNNIAGPAPAPAVNTMDVSSTSLNVNNKRNVADLTADIENSSTDGLTGYEDMPSLMESGQQSQQQREGVNLENMTDEELAIFLSQNEGFMS